MMVSLEAQLELLEKLHDYKFISDDFFDTNKKRIKDEIAAATVIVEKEKRRGNDY